MTLTGSGATSTIVDAGSASRVLEVDAGATAAVHGLMLTGGNPGGVGYGGGVLNAGTLSVEDSTVTMNSATAGGGLANAGGALMVTATVVTDNSDSGYGGGGIQNGGIDNLPGVVVVENSLVSNDSSEGDGGGILNGQNGRPPAPGRRALPVRVSRSSASGDGPVTAAGLMLTVEGTTLGSDSSSNAGGGIANDGGTAVVRASTLKGDTAVAGVGGGISSYGHITISQSTLDRNTACYGGAVELFSGGVASSATIRQSTLDGNSACAFGGGIDVSGASVSVARSTLAGNSAEGGAAIEIEGSSGGTVSDSTVSDNIANTSQGAIQTYGCGSGLLSYLTMSGNSNALALSCSDVTLTGSIIAGSTKGSNCDGAAPLETVGHNLDSGTSCQLAKSSDLHSTAPRLDALAANGGLTQTEALDPGSPAINHGGSRSDGCPPIDQRGVTRPQGAACDIGAFELQR
jgi:hypothetical protein